MQTKIITYDLRRPGQSYELLWQALRSLGAERALESTWFMRSTYTDAQIRDHLMKFIDKNDKLFVGGINGWAAYGITNADQLKAA